MWIDSRCLSLYYFYRVRQMSFGGIFRDIGQTRNRSLQVSPNDRGLIRIRS